MSHQLPPALYYDAPFNLYGISFSSNPAHPHRIALTSFLSTSTNKLQIIDLVPPSSSSSSYGQSQDPYAPQHYSPNPQYSPNPPQASPNLSNPSQSSQTPDFQVIASASHPYPPTKVLFDPAPVQHRKDNGGELLATTGDVLRVWELSGDGEGDGYGSGGGFVGRGWGHGGDGAGMTLRERSKLSNSKSPVTNLPPSTSFSWNPVASNLIVTASVDTTATIWNIDSSQALTQLICHDSPVNDISWLPSSSDVFVSAGHDGSLRAFDTRALEHSTILYESPSSRPLARLSFSTVAQHYLATFGLDDESAIVLDMRSPGSPVAALKGHKGGVSGVSWGVGGRAGKGGGGWVATCGDDSQLLLYDLTQPLAYPPSTTPTPSLGPSTAKSPAASNTQPSSRGGTPSGRTPTIYPGMAYETGVQNDNLAWGQEIGGGGGEVWVGVVGGKRVTCLRM